MDYNPSNFSVVSNKQNLNDYNNILTVPRTSPYIQCGEGTGQVGRVREELVSEKENGNRLSPYGTDIQLFTQMVINTFN